VELANELLAFNSKIFKFQLQAVVPLPEDLYQPDFQSTAQTTMHQTNSASFNFNQLMTSRNSSNALRVENDMTQSNPHFARKGDKK
jgi:hypothetical protein